MLARSLIGSAVDRVQDSDARRSDYVGNYHFWLLNDNQTVNAFALPGGQVFITQAALRQARRRGRAGRRARTRDRATWSIGTRLAEQTAKTQLGQGLTTAVGVERLDGDRHGQQALMIAAMVNKLSKRRVSAAGMSQKPIRSDWKYMASGRILILGDARRDGDPQEREQRE